MPSADTYGLGRDTKESSRLEGQHVVWKTNFGFLLHPRIAKSIPSDARIGDVGTGTGAWILDLAKEQQGSRYR
jgi:methylase of polypeptide subunit release factors